MKISIFHSSALLPRQEGLRSVKLLTSQVKQPHDAEQDLRKTINVSGVAGRTASAGVAGLLYAQDTHPVSTSAARLE